MDRSLLKFLYYLHLKVLYGIVQLIQLEMRVVSISNVAFLTLSRLLNIDWVFHCPALFQLAFQRLYHLVLLYQQILYFAFALFLLKFDLFSQIFVKFSQFWYLLIICGNELLFLCLLSVNDTLIFLSILFKRFDLLLQGINSTHLKLKVKIAMYLLIIFGAGDILLDKLQDLVSFDHEIFLLFAFSEDLH